VRRSVLANAIGGEARVDVKAGHFLLRSIQEQIPDHSPAAKSSFEPRKNVGFRLAGQACPGALSEQRLERSAEWLLARKLDVALLASMPRRDEPLKVTRLFRDKLVAVV
jgi:hypothetical protein